MTATLAGAFLAFQSPATLDDFLRSADARYPKLAAVREEVAGAAAKAQEKRGAFDPAFFASLDAQRYNPSSAPGKAAGFSALATGVTFYDEDGSSLFVQSRRNLGKVKSPLNATGELGEHTVGVRLPLLRDLGVNEKSVALRQARLAVPLAERNLEGFRLGVLRDAATVYWEWVAAGARLRIARDLRRIAVERADATRRRFEAGDEREMNVVEANAEIERRTGAAAKAERDLQKAALKLSLVSGVAPRAAPPALADPAPLDEARLEAGAGRALARRPEVALLDLSRQIVTLDRDLARNARRASLDLTAGIGVDAGSGGVGPTPRIGLLYSVPLRQNAADGRIADAEAKLRKIDQERVLLLQTIRAEVADAASAVRTSLDRVAAARAEVALARRLEAMERAAFELGESTLFLLNQRERATAEAASRVVDALAEYGQADAALRAATADL